MSGDASSAPTVESEYDKAATKGIIHPNKAARKKSRLARAIKAAAAPKVTKAKTTGRAAKKAPRKTSGRKARK